MAPPNLKGIFVIPVRWKCCVQIFAILMVPVNAHKDCYRILGVTTEALTFVIPATKMNTNLCKELQIPAVSLYSQPILMARVISGWDLGPNHVHNGLQLELEGAPRSRWNYVEGAPVAKLVWTALGPVLCLRHTPQPHP